jgi:hypothetical protein
MVDPNPARTSKLAASMKKAFGELFDVDPMLAQNNVDARKVPDSTRTAMHGITGTWDGPATAKSPATRGAITDDVAHSWQLSFPSVTFYDADLLWTPRRGDKLTRKLDGAVYEVIAPYPDALGKTLVQLSNKVRTAPTAPPGLRFNDPANSQYLPLI